VREPVGEHTALSERGIRLTQVELMDARQTQAALEDIQPDHIYHLAGQAYVPQSFADPWGTLSNNIQSQLNLIQSLANLGLPSRVLTVSSGEVYGKVPPENLPISEQQPFRPANPYSVSKAAQDLLGSQYFLSHDVQSIQVRPFNHTGPGQHSNFVAPAFASQIAAIEAGLQEPVLKVGNLAAERDFTDVRDIVRAYVLLLEHGEPGEAYNLGNGEAVSIQQMLDILLSFSDAEIAVETDPARFRPVDVKCIYCDNSKLREATGWSPEYTLDQTLRDVLDEWRTRVHHEGGSAN